MNLAFKWLQSLFWSYATMLLWWFWWWWQTHLQPQHLVRLAGRSERSNCGGVWPNHTFRPLCSWSMWNSKLVRVPPAFDSGFRFHSSFGPGMFCWQKNLVPLAALTLGHWEGSWNFGRGASHGTTSGLHRWILPGPPERPKSCQVKRTPNVMKVTKVGRIFALKIRIRFGYIYIWIYLYGESSDLQSQFSLRVYCKGFVKRFLI